MVGRRFSQKGHASLPTSYQMLGGTHPRRFVFVLSTVALLGVALFLSSPLLLRGWSGDEHSPEGTVAPLPVASTASQPSNGSVVSRALAAVRPDPIKGSSSGLVTRSLSSEALKQSLPLLGQAEARLIHVYQLIGNGEHREALKAAEALVHEHPNFHLANLVLGDLLSATVRPVRQVGDIPIPGDLAAAKQLEVLREQSRRRLRALTERPPEGAVPSQFMSLSAQSRHAIAVDASRSRLYLFKNKRGADDGAPSQMKLIGDYYISVGQSGVEKVAEGDLRTPVGVYYITSSLDASKLPDLYGAGALPINYPNALDLQRGKTGSGIWLHGSPSEQFARPPQASEGCVVLSNQDLKTLLGQVSIRTTPVIIAPELQWVKPDSLSTERQHFEKALEAWRTFKSQGDAGQLRSLYSSRFDNQGQKLADWWPQVESEMHANGARALQLKELSVLNWRDNDDTMVVTFGEVAVGKTRGVTKRQYWIREGQEWKIFNEGNV